ncbi:hypothetical protein BURPS1710b_A2587 [Burkholderia pseudomallei 1710b]|uniref:Uncharacterized protein n=1 Tax=Burkholderia pseudomallei (strain 1710b) TaxID=320372 RepID=Q3JFB6_BURP1|nr:hypothetical protein BURPS1710b_A2587 [Burkholderia pseudomallei 1710b]
MLPASRITHHAPRECANARPSASTMPSGTGVT